MYVCVLACLSIPRPYVHYIRTHILRYGYRIVARNEIGRPNLPPDLCKEFAMGGEGIRHVIQSAPRDKQKDAYPVWIYAYKYNFMNSQTYIQ
jgi:hypothetical protein